MDDSFRVLISDDSDCFLPPPQECDLILPPVVAQSAESSREIDKVLVKLLRAQNMTDPTLLLQVTHLVLDNSHLVHCEGLSDLTPQLSSLSLRNNKLSYLSGLPNSLEHLDVAHNKLSTLTTFGHLKELHTLNVSNNEIDDLIGLKPLKHLRTINADKNRLIMNHRGEHRIPDFDNVAELSLAGNRISFIDFSGTKLPALRLLNLSNNEIQSIVNLRHLTALDWLDLSSNALLLELQNDFAHPTLQVLNLADNLLKKFDSALFPKLSLLNLNANQIVDLNLVAYDNIPTVSLCGQTLGLDLRVFSPVSRLNLSNNSLFLDNFRPLYQLVDLNLSKCRIKVLPKDFIHNFPSLIVLNLNQNMLSSLHGLNKANRLRELYLYGNNIVDFLLVLEVLWGLKITLLDLRNNPYTALFYPNMDDVCSNSDWAIMDSKYREYLNESILVKRVCYRTSLFYHLRASLRTLDRLSIPLIELERIEERYQKMQGLCASSDDSSTPKRFSDLNSESAIYQEIQNVLNCE